LLNTMYHSSGAHTHRHTAINGCYTSVEITLLRGYIRIWFNGVSEIKRCKNFYFLKQLRCPRHRQYLEGPAEPSWKLLKALRASHRFKSESHSQMFVCKYIEYLPARAWRSELTYRSHLTSYLLGMRPPDITSCQNLKTFETILFFESN
jgi:hypothetical protein